MYGTDPIYNGCDVQLRPGIDVSCATRAALDRSRNAQAATL